MAGLPSYEEAVSGGHWLDLVAPYFSIYEYSRLSRVSRRFYDEFAPRLWSDPLKVARLLGLQPNDDLEWYLYFATKHVKTVRSTTRQLVTSLDFRGFASGSAALFAGPGDKGLSATLGHVASLFPSVRCILLDGHTDYDPGDLVRLLKPEDFAEDGSASMPLVLSLAHCSLPLPNTFFHSSYWRQLVYLDMSDLPGSLRGLIKAETFGGGALPNLRILKLRGRELDGASLASIADFSKNRLWSLDLSRTKLSDSSVYNFVCQCFVPVDPHIERTLLDVEGHLAVLEERNGLRIRSAWLGWFCYIVESSWSETFSHPGRYLADAPVYDHERQHRLAGNEPLRSDSTEGVKRTLAGGAGLAIPDWHSIKDAEMCRQPTSLTHLYLSDNGDFTVQGVEMLFHRSLGRLEHFDCAAPAIPTNDRTAFKMAGILGRSHIFRPVFASNLRSLRIHHSLVTHIPSLADPSKSAIAALEYAETTLRERAELVYPQAFVPDLNPRIQSLTLTCLPRVSTGPLVDKLINFLVLAYQQEEDIRCATVSMSRRGPTMLTGLRHIRLEFERSPPSDDPSNDGFDNLDAEALLNSGTGDFSFFDDATWPSSVTGTGTNATAGKGGGGDGTGDSPRQLGLTSAAVLDPPSPYPSKEFGNAVTTAQSVRLPHYPLSGTVEPGSEYVRDTVSWHAERSFSVSVWVGSGGLGRNRVLNAYMSNLSRPSLRTAIRPATPDQTKAGVPAGSCVYSAAWDAIMWTEEENATRSASAPTRESHRHTGRHQMQDVVEAIRQFRTGTKAAYSAAFNQHPSTVPGEEGLQSRPTHRHWTGTLELVIPA